MYKINKSIKELNKEFFNILVQLNKSDDWKSTHVTKGVPNTLLSPFAIKNQPSFIPINKLSDFPFILFSFQPDERFFWDAFPDINTDRYCLKDEISSDIQVLINDLITEFLSLIYFSDIDPAECFTRFGINKQMKDSIDLLPITDLPKIARIMPDMLIARFNKTSYWNNVVNIFSVTTYEKLLEKLQTQNMSYIAQEMATLQKKGRFQQL